MCSPKAAQIYGSTCNGKRSSIFSPDLYFKLALTRRRKLKVHLVDFKKVLEVDLLNQTKKKIKC